MNLESRLGILLGRGTWVSCTLLTAGLILRSYDFSHLGTAVLQIGIGVIIALPVLRVAMMAWHFVRHRQWRFAAVAATVLVVIFIGIVAGLNAA